MKITIEFNLLLGADIPGIPEPQLKAGIPAPPPHEGEKPEGVIKIPQKIVLEKDAQGKVTGTYTHPHWGMMPAENASWSDVHVAFRAPSGNDDKGGQTAYFNFSFTLSDATDQVVGFAGGTAPFFRSFLPIEGRITEKED